MSCGQTASALMTNPETFAQIVNGAITAVDAAGSLATIIEGFGGGNSVADDPNTILKLVYKAAAAAGNTCSTAYTAQFKTSPTGTDYGVILNYVNDPNGDLSSVITTMMQLFTNWSIPLDSDAAQEMVLTMMNQIATQGGILGTQWGTYAPDMNTTVNFVVAYATMAQDDQEDMAMIYAFSAAIAD